ncbi:hypothetical protein LJB89_04595, partial [Tyzzerella sp. OttesenSCG-928-J15]|nr:hypothetical protein [Tyzzerella sp. OttesenSCG-928-J15]
MALSVNYYNRMNSYNNASSLLNGMSSTYGSKRTGGYSSIYSQLLGSNSSIYGTNRANAVSAGTQNFITGMKSAAEDLNATINSMRGYDSKGNASKEKVVSSDVGSLSVKSSNAYSKIDDIMVKVDQAASGQVNEGEALQANKKIYSSQNYKFEIEHEGKKHQISFSVSSGDTTEDMQKKMAEAINSKNIGVKASVSKDAAKGTSALSIETKNTGADSKNSFSIKDITGDAVKKTGTATATKEAQDAVYSINGGEKITSKSNVIDLGKGVSATIKKASDKEITVGMGKENNATAENVKEMVKQFNNMLSNMEDNKDDRGINRLYNQLKGISSSYSGSLSRVGINVSSDGYMSVDETKLNSAVEDGSLNKLLTENKGASYGFANRLSKVTE